MGGAPLGACMDCSPFYGGIPLGLLGMFVPG